VVVLSDPIRCPPFAPERGGDKAGKGEPLLLGTNGVRALFADQTGDTTVWVSLLIVIAASALTMARALRMFARRIR